MKKKELIIIGILTILLAFMDISGLPSALFINIEILDITPFYWTLMFNFIIIGVISFFTLKYLCPNWKLGLNKKELKSGLKKYGIVGIVVSVRYTYVDKIQKCSIIIVYCLKEDSFMLAKIWKKLLMFILIIACLFNVITKLVKNMSLEDELLSSAQYIQNQQDAGILKNK